jgi:hypothetical protein
MAPLFYVQTVIDATAGFFLFLSYTIRIFLLGGGLILLTVGVHPETYVTAFGSGSGSGSQCVRQSGIKRQWRAPDLCNCTRGPRSFRILNSIILHTHHPREARRNKSSAQSTFKMTSITHELPTHHKRRRNVLKKERDTNRSNGRNI